MVIWPKRKPKSVKISVVAEFFLKLKFKTMLLRRCRRPSSSGGGPCLRRCRGKISWYAQRLLLSHGDASWRLAAGLSAELG